MDTLGSQGSGLLEADASRALRAALKRSVLPSPGPRRMPLGIGAGVRMHIDFVQLTRTYLGLYEIEVSRWIRRFARPGVLSFDVGTQFAYDALVLAKLTGARVAAFEADAALRPAIERNLELNPELRSKVNISYAIVGARSGPGRVALDDFASGHDGFHPGFVKIDVDGGEVDVLRGMQHTLRDRRPHLLIETHAPSLELACGEIMTAAGYRPIVVHQRALLPDRRVIPHNRWLVAEGLPV